MITTTEAAQALGRSRSEKKAASSRRNLAKARAKTAAALAAYKAAGLLSGPVLETATAPAHEKAALFTPTLLTGNGSKV